MDQAREAGLAALKEEAPGADAEGKAPGPATSDSEGSTKAPSDKNA